MVTIADAAVIQAIPSRHRCSLRVESGEVSSVTPQYDLKHNNINSIKLMIFRVRFVTRWNIFTTRLILFYVIHSVTSITNCVYLVRRQFKIKFDFSEISLNIIVLGAIGEVSSRISHSNSVGTEMDILFKKVKYLMGKKLGP